MFVYLATPNENLTYNQGQLVIATSKMTVNILSQSGFQDPSHENIMDMLLPRDQEEADIRLLLHCLQASEQGLKTIVISTVDSDIVVLCIHFYPKLNLKEV